MPELCEGDSHWMQTLGSVAFNNVNPRAEQIDFFTIAKVLSRIPRYAGHTEGGILSVAQHSLEGTRAIMRETSDYELAKAFLLHDAHEAYIGDMATPQADALCAIADFYSIGGSLLFRRILREQKRRFDEAIYTAADILYPLPGYMTRAIKHYDVRMSRTERDVRLAKPPQPWADVIEQAEPIEGVDLYEWSPRTMESLFIAALYEFGILTT